MPVGKIEASNDWFVTCVIIMASSSPHNFKFNVGSIQSKVYDDAELMSHKPLP